MFLDPGICKSYKKLEELLVFKSRFLFPSLISQLRLLFLWDLSISTSDRGPKVLINRIQEQQKSDGLS